MKRLAIATLLSAQLAAAVQPAFAADLANAQEQRGGAFAGLRLRIALDGPQRRQVRAGFALAPTLGVRDRDGETRTRIGEGLEFGYRTGRPLSFSLAGRDVDGRRFGATPGDGGSDAVPRVALAVVAVAATLGLLYWGFSEAIDCDADEECS